MATFLGTWPLSWALGLFFPGLMACLLNTWPLSWALGLFSGLMATFLGTSVGKFPGHWPFSGHMATFLSSWPLFTCHYPRGRKKLHSQTTCPLNLQRSIVYPHLHTPYKRRKAAHAFYLFSKLNGEHGINSWHP